MIPGSGRSPGKGNIFLNISNQIGIDLEITIYKPQNQTLLKENVFHPLTEFSVAKHFLICGLNCHVSLNIFKITGINFLSFEKLGKEPRRTFKNYLSFNVSTIPLMLI